MRQRKDADKHIRPTTWPNWDNLRRFRKQSGVPRRYPWMERKRVLASLERLDGGAQLARVYEQNSTGLALTQLRAGPRDWLLSRLAKVFPCDSGLKAGRRRRHK